MPALEGVKCGEVAVAVSPAPAVSVTAAPTAWPPPAQPAALANGPQTKKLTEPVGLPPAGLPVTATWSCSPSARLVVCADGTEVTVAAACPTVKHSPAEPSLDPA